ncbi:MAG: membrane protein, partial [Bacteroidetes bacterium]
MTINQEKMWITLKEYVIITIALFIQALAWIAFLIPSEIVGGGITGLSGLLYFVTDIPMGIINLAFNVVLILISIKSLGKSFGIKTAYSLIIVSFFLTLLQSLITEPVVDDRFLS